MPMTCALEDLEPLLLQTAARNQPRRHLIQLSHLLCCNLGKYSHLDKDTFHRYIALVARLVAGRLCYNEVKFASPVGFSVY